PARRGAAPATHEGQNAGEDNLLTIKGTKEQVPEEKAEKVHRYERTYGAFERTFRLSASIDANKIKATCDLGVLTITLPKAETAKPHLIKVEITPAKALLTPDLRSPREEGGMGRSPTGPESLDTY